MPSFPVKHEGQLSEYINGLTLADAAIIIERATEDGEIYAAIDNSKTRFGGKWSIVVVAYPEDEHYYVWMDEYHPRKCGKASYVAKGQE